MTFGKISITLVLFLLVTCATKAVAQTTDTTINTVVADTSAPKTDTLSKFDSFNKKAEAFFKKFPVPLFSYSTEAGTVLGLAKFNLFHPSKKDTISKPSKLSEVATFSTKGRVNISVSTELLLKENKYMIISYVNYRKQPEYTLGIGNDVHRDDLETVEFDRFTFVASGLRRLHKNLYAGINFNISTYFNTEIDSTSILRKENAVGLEGGNCFAGGFAAALDSRDNRYNASKGWFIMANAWFFEKWLGSDFKFTKILVDVRKYYNPWLKHVIALQATTTSTGGNVPYFELAKMGGDQKMRGYYEGAIRDKVLIDGQIEYRLPIWKIFGATAFIGTGRVAESYKGLSMDGFRLSYGGGIRIKVDSKNNTNLRFDMGFGPHNVKGFYINFAEAF